MIPVDRQPPVGHRGLDRHHGLDRHQDQVIVAGVVEDRLRLVQMTCRLILKMRQRRQV